MYDGVKDLLTNDEWGVNIVGHVYQALALTSHFKKFILFIRKIVGINFFLINWFS